VETLLPGAQPTAPRAPFVLLVLALLGGGLVLLLLLNTASAADSIRQHQLQRQISGLQLREQEMQRRMADLQAPGALAEQARKLGMVPSGEPGFLVLMPDGTFRIVGDPVPATAPPPGVQQPAAQQPGPPPATAPGAPSDRTGTGGNGSGPHGGSQGGARAAAGGQR
jgi:cell division protein FtsB